MAKKKAALAEIKVACDVKLHLELDQFHALQGDLKSLSDEAYDQLKAEIVNTGFAFPIHVWFDEAEARYHIIGGHQRLRTAQKMREEGYRVPALPAVAVEAQDLQAAKRRVLQDVSQYGKVERQGLYEFMHDAGIDFADLSASFIVPEMSLNLASFEKEFFLDPDVLPLGDPDDAPAVRPDPKAKPGDLFILGDHRLLCGDSTNIQHVERLLDGNKADMVFTDPPYNVNYGADGNKNPAGWTQRHDRTIMNDHMDRDKFREFCQGFISCIVASTDGCVFVFGPPGPDGRVMFTECDLAMHCSTTIVWKKDRLVLGRGKYHNKYEPCWFGWTKSGARFTDDRTLTNVWDFDRPHKSELHPTMKPVELVETALLHASQENDSVLDLFGGSGTTMIAAEKNKRRAYLMELDPKYVDVICRRWQGYTGKQAQLLGDDGSLTPFDELA